MYFTYLFLLHALSIFTNVLQVHSNSIKQKEISATQYPLPFYSYTTLAKYIDSSTFNPYGTKCIDPYKSKVILMHDNNNNENNNNNNNNNNNKPSNSNKTKYEEHLPQKILNATNSVLKETYTVPNHKTYNRRSINRHIHNYPHTDFNFHVPQKKLLNNEKKLKEILSLKNLRKHNSNKREDIRGSEEYRKNLKLQYVKNNASGYEEKDVVHNKNMAKFEIGKNEEADHNLKFSPNGDRIEFHVQSHNGPKTYIFGFDTGNGMNRQYRLEERFKDGTVEGHYGYYDAKGKLKVVKYVAKPIEGYVERHHERNADTSEK